MLKFLKSPSISPHFLIYIPRYSYESLWTRFARYFKKSPKTSQSLYHQDLKQSASLSEQMPFQYRMDETKPKSMPPIMKLEAQLREIEEQKEISEIEKTRMQEIDKNLGTNTHFHEIETNEERLNSEFVMEREALREFAQKDDFLETLVTLDPQQKLSKPKIRNFNEFAKKALEMRKYPKHLKENTIVNDRHESLGDNYKYLDFNINEQLMRNRASLLSNDQDFKKYMDFLGQEIMYANYSLARIQRIEEKISQEYFTMINSFNIQPMLYDNWSYYSKDPRLTSKSMFDIYRVPISPNTQDVKLIKEIDIHPREEECVLKIDEIMDFLNKSFENNEEIEAFIESLRTNNRKSSVYREFCLDKEHKIMAIVLDLPRPLILFKDLHKNELLKGFLKDVDEVLMDQKGGFYYIRTNDLARKCFLMYQKIKDLDIEEKTKESLIYEESDLNYELKVKKNMNYEEGFLICQKIAGTPANEIGLIDLKPNGKAKIQRTFDRKQGIFWVMKSNEEAFYFTEKNSNKIYRIFRHAKIQTLTLINQSLSHKKDLISSNNPIEKPLFQENLIQKSSELNLSNEESYLIEAFQKKENYEVFYEAKEGEEIKNFEAFRHYILIELVFEGKESFKVYNCRNQAFHTVLIPEPLYEIQKTYLQNYQGQFFNFNLSTPHLPNKLMSYNMALREFSVIFANNYPGVDFANYIIERVEAISRDNKKIPISFIYNKTKVNENSVVILHAEYYHKKSMKREFQPEIISLLDRGFIYAFPHIRGSYDINDNWFEEGSGLKKLTMICDYIDTATFILKNEISKRVFAFGVNPLGGLCAIISILREPKLFSAGIIDNGVFDVIEYIEKHRNSQEMKAIFGDFEEKVLYDFIKSYSPYHLRKLALNNCLITADTRSDFAGNSRKFMAKIRENENNTEVFYKEFNGKDFQKEKYFNQAAFFTEIAFNKKY